MSSPQSVPNHYRIFVNLPVRDFEASIKFYTAIGFVQNSTFTGGEASMMSWPVDPENPTDNNPINVMIMTHKFYESFLPSTHVRGVGSPQIPVQVSSLLALAIPSISAVDSMMGKVQAAGGTIDIRPVQSHKTAEDEEPYMYGRAFTDLDGHIWETAWLDVEKMPRAQKGQ